MNKPYVAPKIIAGVPVFPDCGCIYTTNDDGITFCALHAAAEDILEVAKWAESVLTNETGFSDTRLSNIRAAIAKAEGR